MTRGENQDREGSQDECGLPAKERFVAQRKMSHPESVLVVNGSEGELRRINAGRATAEFLFIDPYVTNAFIARQQFRDAKPSIIVGDGIDPANDQIVGSTATYECAEKGQSQRDKYASAHLSTMVRQRTGALAEL